MCEQTGRVSTGQRSQLVSCEPSYVLTKLMQLDHVRVCAFCAVVLQVP